ncbi:MAG: glycosyltransferase family 39 protein [Anaerolineae bacterium]|nr:glycosyltransferase family 39 protein [Anaerolineae bacterium]
MDKRTDRLSILVALITLLAAAFRVYGLRWEDDLLGYPHPDERHLANTMLRIALPTPIDWDLLLNDADHSPLNPRKLIPNGGGEHYDLAYGTFPVYVYRATAVILSRLSGDPGLDSYQAFGLIGRAITVLFSLLTVLLVYAMGRRISGPSIALLGAALLAVCVLHIQLSHFMTVDLLMSAMLTGGLFFAVRFAQDGRTRDAIGMGVALGLAMACKFNGITLGAGIGAAYIVAWLGRKRSLKDLLAFCVPLTLLFWFLAFAAFEYYAVRDPYTYARAIGVQAKMVSGETDWPYTRQYINTAPYWFQTKNLVLWGLGLPLGIAALAGLLGAGAELLFALLRPDPTRDETQAGPHAPRSPLAALGDRLAHWTARQEVAGLLVLLGWAAPFYLYTAGLHVKFLRYMLPLTPVLCLLAARLLLQLGARLAARARRQARRVGLAWALPALVILPSLLWALAYMRVYAQEHPWQAASRWFYENAPQGAAYTWEAWGDRLPVDLPAEDLYRIPYGFMNQDVWMHIYHDMPPQDKLAHISDGLCQADYVILSTPRIYLSVARLPWRYPVEIRYYELLFTEQLGYELVARFTAYPGLGALDIVDLSADQSFFDYEHPLVLIYRKTRDLTPEEWAERFAAQLQTEPRASREGNDPPVELPIPR